MEELKNKVNTLINELLDYSLEKGIIHEIDYIYLSNTLINEFEIYKFIKETTSPRHIVDILADLSAIAYEMGVIKSNDIQTKDNFEAHLINLIMPRPSEVIYTFNKLKHEDPNRAVMYLYNLSKDTNYIKTRRIAQNISFTAESKYAPLDITINLSKPEKDPALIAKLKTMPQDPFKYPKCMLCSQNEGFGGNISYDSRANMRIIPLSFSEGDDWYFQYSPYAYFNEHAIILNKNHQDMVINKNTFSRLIDFLDMFPGYFIGSNADLPIVGGSILNHDHYQAGRATFPIEKCEIEHITTINNVSVNKVHWALSTIRLKGSDKTEIVNLASHILDSWINYENKDLMIINSKEERHNTITPIARKNNGIYELDLILRNNITTAKHPLGVFHPHAHLHHIKKENIGLIEAAGLAILPARLKNELALVADKLEGKAVDNSKIESHLPWISEIKVGFNGQNALEYVYQCVGKVFAEVLECSGVFKDTLEGNKAFKEFILGL